jgi:hypothetical protein
VTSHRSGIAGGIAPTAVPATQARDSSHLPAIDGSMMVKPVALLAGRAKLLAKPLPMCHQHPDPPRPVRLLPACRERPCRRRTAEQHDELASSHGLSSGSGPQATTSLNQEVMLCITANFTAHDRNGSKARITASQQQ